MLNLCHTISTPKVTTRRSPRRQRYDGSSDGLDFKKSSYMTAEKFNVQDNPLLSIAKAPPLDGPFTVTMIPVEIRPSHMSE